MPITDPFSFTDFEECICFDADDPDFMNGYASHDEFEAEKENFLTYYATVPSPAMSLTSLATSNRSHSFSSITSLDDLSRQEPTVLSIEELRNQLNSCFTCGVSWYEDHVSLDCAECGGYSLERPCVLCDGKCHTIWKRDLTMSHASGKARWLGECAFLTKKQSDTCDRILKEIAPDDSQIYNHRSNY